jgi:hypothetical protein
VFGKLQIWNIVCICWRALAPLLIHTAVRNWIESFTAFSRFSEHGLGNFRTEFLTRNKRDITHRSKPLIIVQLVDCLTLECAVEATVRQLVV